MAFSVFESTNMRAVHYAERIFDCVMDEQVENGTFGYFEELADGESHIYKFVKGVKAGADVFVANNPAWNYDECRITNQRRDQFVIPAGVPFRAFGVEKLDEFGITIEGISEATRSVVEGVTDFAATPVYLTIGADGKLVASTSKSEGAVMEAQIMRKRMVGANLVVPAREVGGGYVMYEAKINVLA